MGTAYADESSPAPEAATEAAAVSEPVSEAPATAVSEASPPAEVGPPPAEEVAPKDPAPVAESVAPAPAPAPVPASIAVVPPAGLGATAERPPSEKGDEGRLGPFRAGVLVGIGAPSIMSAQIVGTYKGWVGVTAEAGMLPTVSLPIGEGVSVQQSHMSFSARVHPFHGMFFLGCGLGASTLQAHTSATSQGVSGQIGMTAKTVFVNPQLGFLHRFKFGLALGMDVGVQIPLSGSTSTDASINGTDVETPEGVRNAVAFAQKQPIPMLNLLRIGYVL